MKVVRVTVEAPVCSFRMPHFLIGRQLTFDMPPPSTIYGHVASAVGRWLDPESFRFAYHFTKQGTADDLEHLHMIAPAGGNLPGTNIPKSVEGTIQPTKRQFLLGARLTLYVTDLPLGAAFRRPAFPVILGRSQDLADCVAVEEVNLDKAEEAYFESTILPEEYRRRLSRGTMVVMSRYIAPPPWREVTWGKYVVLPDHAFYRHQAAEGSREMLHIDGEQLEMWVDPDAPQRTGLRRAVVFHSFR